MPINRRVSLLTGLRYKGGSPMWVWILHRISGLGMVLFVSLHILAGFLTQQMASDVGIAINTIYESFYFQIFIYFFVIFHTLNGTRIIILDVWPQLIEYQQEVTWLQWLIFIPLYGLMVFVIIARALYGQ